MGHLVGAVPLLFGQSLALGDSSQLHSHRHGECREQDGECTGGRYAQRVPSDEFLCPVAPGIAAGDDRRSVVVALDVGGEFIHRCVAASRFLPHRHHDDVVEIAGQLSAQSRRGGLPRSRDRLDARGVVYIAPCIQCCAGWWRNLMADHPLDLAQPDVVESECSRAGQ